MMTMMMELTRHVTRWSYWPWKTLDADRAPVEMWVVSSRISSIVAITGRHSITGTVVCQLVQWEQVERLPKQLPPVFLRSWVRRAERRTWSSRKCGGRTSLAIGASHQLRVGKPLWWKGRRAFTGLLQRLGHLGGRWRTVIGLIITINFITVIVISFSGSRSISSSRVWVSDAALNEVVANVEVGGVLVWPKRRWRCDGHVLGAFCRAWSRLWNVLLTTCDQHVGGPPAPACVWNGVSGLPQSRQTTLNLGFRLSTSTTCLHDTDAECW